MAVSSKPSSKCQYFTPQPDETDIKKTNGCVIKTLKQIIYNFQNNRQIINAANHAYHIMLLNTC